MTSAQQFRPAHLLLSNFSLFFVGLPLALSMIWWPHPYPQVSGIPNVSPCDVLAGHLICFSCILLYFLVSAFGLLGKRSERERKRERGSASSFFGYESTSAGLSLSLHEGGGGKQLFPFLYFAQGTLEWRRRRRKEWGAEGKKMSERDGTVGLGSFWDGEVEESWRNTEIWTGSVLISFLQSQGHHSNKHPSNRVNWVRMAVALFSTMVWARCARMLCCQCELFYLALCFCPLCLAEGKKRGVFMPSFYCLLPSFLQSPLFVRFTLRIICLDHGPGMELSRTFLETGQPLLPRPDPDLGWQNRSLDSWTGATPKKHKKWWIF